jgi:hypothetical protein
MRRTTCGLAAAVLGSLAVAAPAMADGEITDPCGTDTLSLPGIVNRDPTIPSEDICSVDVRGAAGSGALRALHAVTHVSGDTANRGGAAAYTLNFTAGTCTGTLRYADGAPGATTGSLHVLGQCGGKSTPCPLQLPNSACFTFTGGVPFDRALPVAGAKLAGSTVTLDFDPNTLPAHAVPQALLDGFRAGQSLSGLSAYTFLRVPDGPGAEDAAFWVLDQADGTKPVGLGRAARRR